MQRKVFSISIGPRLHLFGERRLLQNCVSVRKLGLGGMFVTEAANVLYNDISSIVGWFC